MNVDIEAWQLLGSVTKSIAEQKYLPILNTSIELENQPNLTFKIYKVKEV